jgi:hypothetical protein
VDRIGHTEDGQPVRIELHVPAASRAASGPITGRIAGAGLDLEALALDWLVTTNRGWAHLRGVGRHAGIEVPFRCDLYSARAEGREDVDLAAIRVYGPGSDPTRDGPTAKVTVTLPPGSIRLGV